MKIYQSIDELPLYNFDRFLATQNDNWFIDGFDGRQKIVKIESPEAKIMDEYYKAIDDKAFANKLQKWAKIDNLITKFKVVTSILEIMYKGFADTYAQQQMRFDLIQELAKWRYKMPTINTPLGDVEALNKIANDLKGIENQIAILKHELKDDSKQEQVKLFKQIAIVQMGLQLTFKIDPKTTVVSEWIEYVKLLQEKAKQN